MTHKEEILTPYYRDFINSRSLHQLHRELKSLENTRDFDPLEAERKIWFVRERMNVLLGRQPKDSMQCPTWSTHCDRNYLLWVSLTFPQK